MSRLAVLTCGWMMAINVVARKFLWGRAGNQCAFEGCSQELAETGGPDEFEAASVAGILVGEEAHIRSSRDNGPRYEASYPTDKLDSYENLLLLCPTHHTIIDKNNGAAFSVDDLLGMKAEHEHRVKSSLSGTDEKRRALEERTAISIAVWEQKIGLDDWEDFTFGLAMPVPQVRVSRYKNLYETCEWLLRKRWDSGFPNLVQAFENLRLVLSDLASLIGSSMDVVSEEEWRMRRETKELGRWDPPAYEIASLVEDKRVALYFVLTIEATRAMNFVIDAVIADIEPFYRFDQGLCLMGSGDGVFSSSKYRLEYSADRVKRSLLYPSLETLEEIVGSLVEGAPRSHSFESLFHLFEEE